MDFNQLIIEHKTNIQGIVTTFTKINHSFDNTNNIKPIINMSIVHKYIIDNKYNISYLTNTSCKDLKLIFPDLPNKFTKKNLIEDYTTFLNSL